MTAHAELSPLEVPEVLILVFTHLGLHSVRAHASLVCRLWHKVAAPFLRARPFVWYRPQFDVESHAILRRRLQETKALIVKKPNYYGPYNDVPTIWERTQGWNELTEHLHTLAGNHQLQITEFTVLQRLESDIQVLPILVAIGPQLTRLRLENLGRSDDAPLETFLILCPQLLLLDLHYTSVGLYHDNFRNRLQSQHVLPSRLKLRSLTLENMGIEERSLLRLLESCLDLRELRLIQLLQGVPSDSAASLGGITDDNLVSFSKQTLLLQIAGFCPSLRIVHFSGGTDPSWISRRSDAVSQAVRLFPKLREWSFQSIFTERMMKDLKACQPNTLTSIEILHGGAFIADGLSAVLHQYLCESPQLLHLRAPDLIFPIMWFDLEGILDSRGFFHRRSPSSSYTYSYEMVRVLGRYIEPFHRKVWACRNLQTLHFRCDSKPSDNSCGTRSRVLFGYLSRVCPRLQDLGIKYPTMRLDLDGGFCLLSRMKELRRLMLMIGGHHRKHIRCLDWMARSMTPFQRFTVTMRIDTFALWKDMKCTYARTAFASTDASRAPSTKVQERRRCRLVSRKPIDTSHEVVQAEAEGHNVGIDKESDYGTDRDYMIDGVDMRNIGRWKDVADLFEDRFSQDWSCWPHLETIELRLVENDQTKIEKAKSTIRYLRPDAEVI